MTSWVVACNDTRIAASMVPRRLSSYRGKGSQVREDRQRWGYYMCMAAMKEEIGGTINGVPMAGTLRSGNIATTGASGSTEQHRGGWKGCQSGKGYTATARRATKVAKVVAERDRELSLPVIRGATAKASGLLLEGCSPPASHLWPMCRSVARGSKWRVGLLTKPSLTLGPMAAGNVTSEAMAMGSSVYTFQSNAPW